MRFALIGLLSILFSVTSRVCCKDPDFETQPASLPAVYQPKCGQRHISGVDVNIQKFKDGEAHFGEWPHMCAIFDSGKQRLGGASLISKGVVLTAAHIVVKYNATANRLFVRCGDWDVNNDHEPRAHQDRNVRAIEVHYLHIPPSNRNNIALLFTEQDFDLSEHIDTICLPQPEDVFDNQVCFATGWGKDQFGEEGVFQQRLKEVSLPIVEDAANERTIRLRQRKATGKTSSWTILCSVQGVLGRTRAQETAEDLLSALTLEKLGGMCRQGSSILELVQHRVDPSSLYRCPQLSVLDRLGVDM